jgi:hypothetical protein
MYHSLIFLEQWLSRQSKDSKHPIFILLSMAQLWPFMESLSLNPLKHPSLGISVLNVFSALCPRIRHLGLYIIAKMMPVLLLPPVLLVKPIVSLLTVDVGVSDIHADRWDISVSAFLAHICLNIYSLQRGAPWTESKRSQLISLDHNPSNDIYICIIEESAAIQLACRLTCFKPLVLPSFKGDNYLTHLFFIYVFNASGL